MDPLLLRWGRRGEGVAGRRSSVQVTVVLQLQPAGARRMDRWRMAGWRSADATARGSAGQGRARRVALARYGAAARVSVSRLRGGAAQGTGGGGRGLVASRRRGGSWLRGGAARGTGGVATRDDRASAALPGAMSASGCAVRCGS